MLHKSSRAAAAAVVGLLTVPFTAHAELILAESFFTGSNADAGEYEIGPGTRLHTQGPNVAGYAAGSVWGSGTLTTQPQVVEGSLDAPGASYEAGGKVQFDSAPVDDIYRARARSLATPYVEASANGPLYLSGMIETDAFPDNPENVGRRGYALMGFTSAVGAFGVGSTNTLFGYYLGFRGAADNSIDPILRHRQGTTGVPAGTGVQEDIVLMTGAAPDTTYQFVVRSDVNAVSGNQEAVRWWINPTDVSSEESATSTALATGTLTDYSLGNANSDISRVTVASYNWDASFYVDELRMGTAFVDVVGSASPSLAGDFDGDGFVGGSDLNIVLGKWGQNVPNGDKLQGDGDGDGFVGGGDLNMVLGEWGQGTAPAAVAALTAVPEPAALGLIGLAGLAVARRRRA